MQNENESIQVAPSVDGGNGLPPTTPNLPPVAETPATPPAETKEEATKPTEQELFELPDGRKVDAVTLTKEWKENFLPDYTRKSQELARNSKSPETSTTPKPTSDDPLSDPDWQPTSYSELLQLAEQRALKAIEVKELASIEARNAIENEVVTQLTEVKKIDANVNENALFLHATKYGFRDLKVAYQNMKDMNQLAKTVQETTAKNIAKRNDPVSITPGNSGNARPDPSQFSTARDYLRSLNT